MEVNTQIRTVEEVVSDIHRRIEGLWNGLSEEYRADLSAMWSGAQLLFAGLETTQELLGVSMRETQQVRTQLDLTLHELQSSRAQWIAMAESQQRRMLAAIIAEVTNKDFDAIHHALNYYGQGRQKADGVALSTEHQIGLALEALGKQLQER